MSPELEEIINHLKETKESIKLNNDNHMENKHPTKITYISNV